MVGQKRPSIFLGENRTLYSVPEGQLVALLKSRGELRDAGLVCVQPDGGIVEEPYADLFDHASRICGGLQKAGLRAGDRVILHAPFSQHVIPAFWGCILAGVVPIPLNTAISYETMNSQVKKLVSVWTRFGKPRVLTVTSLRKALSGVSRYDASFAPDCMDLADLAGGERATAFHEPDPSDTAAMFLTSGSTGLVKGVPQTHAAMLAMADGTIQMNGFTGEDTTLNWMSLDHAGSLVFLGVMPIVLGCRQVHVPIDHILQDPLRWLDLIERYRASISWAPNFVFSMYIERSQRLREGHWNLSSMRFMVNAGEAIGCRTAREFIRLLEVHGLPPDALRPAFGMVETCSGVTWSRGFTLANTSDADAFVDLGPCIPGAGMRVIDEAGSILAEGETGRLQIRGPSVFAGYEGQPEVNAGMFHDGWMNTGDLAFLRDGHLYITGREKDVIIINGNNYYCHEIEEAAEEVPGVARGCVAACGVRRAGENTESLALFYSAAAGQDPVLLQKAMRVRIMKEAGINPAIFIPMDPAEFPRTEIGKIQRSRIRKAFENGSYDGRVTRGQPAGPRDGKLPGRAGGAERLAEQIAGIWKRVLGIDEIGYDETFFDLGGQSLSAVRVQQELEAVVGRPVSMVELFSTPTVRMMADHFAGEPPPRVDGHESQAGRATGAGRCDVAVIGIGCRFPGADNPGAFWRNLEAGIESITTFSPEQAIASGVPPEIARDPRHVNAAPMLKDVEGFDLEFWNYPMREAKLMDPQHRVFLETAWEAFEDAGYRPSSALGRVGVFASAATNTYLQNNVFANRDWVAGENGGALLTVDSMSGFNVMVANDKDYMPTRVSYKLDLTGPSMSIQTACSSALVAVHEAFRSIQNGECDMALAGGCALMLPQFAGHQYEEGMITCPDGHCRAYDADAMGTIFGSGSGAVLLKRLDAAVADGDHIYAVIRGSAVANDGGLKMGYTAPSLTGEYRAIKGAIRDAGISADTIGLIEGHGTGTLVGDPIEVQALTKAFRHDTQRTGFCALGSVKTNIGHMGIASGIAGFIKAVLALHHGKIPATLHFRNPNPGLDLPSAPFFVNSQTRPWEKGGHPRRAGVNSLGIGGTNVHTILEEAPALVAGEEPDRGAFLLPVSAHGPDALRELKIRYAEWLKANPAVSLRDVCFTAQRGRAAFKHRFACAGQTRDQIIERLLEPGKDSPGPVGNGRMVFLFTGQGSQYRGMGRGLYAAEPAFRAAFDECSSLFTRYRDRALRDLVFGESGENADFLDKTAWTQPALFSLQVALVRLYQSLGVRPDIVLGHGVGEITAAWCAGVMTLEDAVRVVEARGRLMQELPPGGAMAAVKGDVKDCLARLAETGVRCEAAAFNSPTDLAIAGDAAAVAAACEALTAEGFKTTRLNVSHAFHSSLMEPMLDAFRSALKDIEMSPPGCILISNVTGIEHTAETVKADYWPGHVRSPVDFSGCIGRSLALGGGNFVEMGPDPVLCGMGRRAPGAASAAWWPALRRNHDDTQVFYSALAGLFSAGIDIAWEGLDKGLRGRRIALPTYPWQHRRCWIDPSPGDAPGPAVDGDPLLARTVTLPRHGQRVYGVKYDAEILPELAEHRVFGRIVPPAAMFVSQLLRTALDTDGRRDACLRDITFVRPLVPAGNESREVQICYTRAGDGYDVELTSTSANERIGLPTNANLHVKCELAAAMPGEGRETLDAARSDCTEPAAVETVTAHMEAMRIEVGPSFRWMASLKRGHGKALAELRVPECLPPDAAGSLPAGLLDCHWQTVLAALPSMPLGTVIPAHIEQVILRRIPERGRFWAYGTIKEESKDVIHADVILFDDRGGILMETRGLSLKHVSETILPGAKIAPILLRRVWEPMESAWSPVRPTGRVWVVGGIAAATLVKELSNRGYDTRAAPDGLPGDFSESASPWTIVFVAEGSGMQEVDAACSRLSALCRSIASRAHGPGRLLVVTHNAQRVNAGERPSPAQAAVWGQALAVAQERPDWIITLLDLENADGSAKTPADCLAAENGAEMRLACRNGRIMVARLESMTVDGPHEPVFNPASVQMVTGGLGGLGLATVEWMTEHGARKFVLASRHEPSACALERLAALRGRGCAVITVPCDVVRMGDVKDLVARATSMGAIETLIHAAGARSDGFVETLDEHAMDAALHPKVRGAWNLHVALKNIPVARTVYFSSVSGLLGAAGQSNYAAANAALDAFAAWRTDEGQRTVSISWGPWSSLGITASLTEPQVRRIRESGYDAMPAPAALEMLGRLLACPDREPHVAVMAGRWQSLAGQPGGSALWRRLTHPGTTAQRAERPRTDLQKMLAQCPENETEDILRKHLVRLVAELTGVGATTAVDTSRGFIDLGMDSMATLDFRKRLERDLGRKLISTMIFDYPTIEKMAGHLASEVAAGGTAGPEDAGADQDSGGDLNALVHDDLVDLLARELES